MLWLQSFGDMELKLVTKQIDDPNNPIYINAVNYYILLLMGKHVIPNDVKRLDIKFSPSLKDDGECYMTKNKAGNKIVTIRIKSTMSFMRIIVTLAHESVHAVQMIQGKLKITPFGDWIWNNKNYGMTPYNIPQDDVYKKLPWEKEAVYKENDLFRKYMEYYLESNS